MKKKCIVLFSGGLDSRLVIKIMQERGFDILAIYFNLPFSKKREIHKIRDFCKKERIGLKIFDCSKKRLLKEYLEVIKKGKHGRGAGFNPCIDCKIFMFKKTKEFADKKKIKIIATGEVLGQRPMSQTAKAMKIIAKESGFEIIRPLADFKISGRNRKKQIELAKKYQIDYPSPAGGCILCEKTLKNRFKILIKNNLINNKNLPVVSIGRHFFKDNCWFVVGRNKKECEIIEKFKRHSIKSSKGEPGVYFNKIKGKKFAKELQEDYKKNGKKKFSKSKL